jgi:hypothetical protein
MSQIAESWRKFGRFQRSSSSIENGQRQRVCLRYQGNEPLQYAGMLRGSDYMHLCNFAFP